jgi:Cys-tRNA(Pro)/Cys-tRNA(Cys) deacylase
MRKTNALRLLDQHKINYDIQEYNYEESDLSGLHVIKELNQEAKYVYKTLVLNGDKSGYIVCLVPVDKEIDLKKLAKASSNKNVEMVHVSNLEKITGYIRGGCSPIGMKKVFPTYAYNGLDKIDKVFISAGCRGMQVHLATKDLIQFCHINLIDVLKD